MVKKLYTAIQCSQLFYHCFVLISLHRIILCSIVLFCPVLQEEQMYALAADCSIGSAGSAILMTHSKQASGEPALLYLKVSHVT